MENGDAIDAALWAPHSFIFEMPVEGDSSKS